MAAKFEIFNDKGGKFHFHLKVPNGEIIAASQGYETKASASVKKATSLIAAGLAATLIASCGTKPTSPATVTVTQPASAPTSAPAFAPEPAAPPSSAAASAAQITIPDLTGENAEIAQSKLEGLGLTKVELSSSNPKYSMVLVPSNWTVTSIDPPPGSQVSANDPVIVKVTKP